MKPVILIFTKHKTKKFLSLFLNVAIVCLLIMLLAGCGGSDKSNPPPPPPVNNTPIITSVSPSSIGVGALTFSLTINGSNFKSNSKVYWNESARSASFVNATQLKIDITSEDVAAAGNVMIFVLNPSPNAATSNQVGFVINNPVPVVLSLNPSGIPAGSNSANLIIYGKNFISNSTIKFGSSNLTGKFINSTRMGVSLSSGDLLNARNVAITISNPTPGGGTSDPLNLNVTAAGMSVLTKSLPDGKNGMDYDYALQAAGGIPAYSWTLDSGSLPLGLTLASNGTISGNPAAVASDTTSPFSVRIRDSVSSTTTQALSIRVRSRNIGRNDVCDPTTASVISNGTIRASISPYGDIDVYSFHASAGAHIFAEIKAQRLSLYGDPTSTDIFLDSFLEILDSNCARLGYNDDLEPGIVKDSAISNFYIPQTGTYYMRISDVRGDGRPDYIYALQLSGAD